MTEGTLGNRTNNRLESMKSQIQDSCSSKNTLCGFAQQFFGLLQEQTQETDLREAQRNLKRRRSLFQTGSVQESYANYLTSLAQIEVHKQLTDHEKITLKEVSSDTRECHIQFKNSIIKTTPDSCTLYFRNSYTLPCQHIFAVRKRFELPLFDIDLCDAICTKEYVKRIIKPSAHLPPPV